MNSMPTLTIISACLVVIGLCVIFYGLLKKQERKVKLLRDVIHSTPESQSIFIEVPAPPIDPAGTQIESPLTKREKTKKIKSSMAEDFEWIVNHYENRIQSLSKALIDSEKDNIRLKEQLETFRNRDIKGRFISKS